KINAVAERISYYERDLAALGGKRQQLAEVIVAFSGNIPATVDVEYSYYAYGCGWQPVYGFAADPEKSSLDFRQQAYIWQNTGQDWNGARVVLSTKAPDFRLAPGNLYPWTLYREEEAKPNQAVKMQESMMMFDEEMAAPAPAMRSMAKAAEQPVSMQRSSHLEWALGPRVIPSGTPVTLTLQEDKWQAEFYYTLRPSLGTESFVTAKVKLPKAVELSNGRAVFTLDKRLCGTNNNFSANSNEFELYFGTDDRVTVETLDLLKQRGKEGFFTTTNTFNWEWQFTVKNRRDRTITIRLEDPMPQAADSSIKIKNDSSPKPEKEKMTYFWKADVKAGQDLVITHKVHASASGEQRLIPGR
ncbi:DUF4139 domain-containing protein, partial [Desulfovibrio sp. OttesenSCG-928-C06]|nr:DUF4139 domain-containing protein [Desulfovibrio sp. OttesenSCG-928-C06]